MSARRRLAQRTENERADRRNRTRRVWRCVHCRREFAEGTLFETLDAHLAGHERAVEPVVADVPPVEPCERCGSTVLVRKMRAVICGGCRVVRAYR